MTTKKNEWARAAREQARLKREEELAANRILESVHQSEDCPHKVRTRLRSIRDGREG